MNFLFKRSGVRFPGGAILLGAFSTRSVFCVGEPAYLAPHNQKKLRMLMWKEVNWVNSSHWKEIALEALENKGPLKEILIWNASVYLWFSGITSNLEEGINKSTTLIEKGIVKHYFLELISSTKRLKASR